MEDLTYPCVSEDGPRRAGTGVERCRIAEAFGMSTRSLEHWRKQAVEEGPQAVLERYYPTRPRCPQAGWSSRGAVGEAGVLAGAERAHRLDLELVGGQAGEIADRGLDFARNGATHAQKTI